MGEGEGCGYIRAGHSGGEGGGPGGSQDRTVILGICTDNLAVSGCHSNIPFQFGHVTLGTHTKTEDEHYYI